MDGPSQRKATPDRVRSQPKTSSQNPNKHVQYSRYTVAWICALHIELTAAKATLDEVHNEVFMHEEDSNPYSLGSIGHHNIVIACLPIQQYGTNNAATLLANLMRTFPLIKFGLMVGIGGGAPSETTDIRLGDVVVGTKVVQYDLGKYVSGGQFEQTGSAKLPLQSLLSAVSHLASRDGGLPDRICLTLSERFQNYPEYCRPTSPDQLFQATYNHRASNPDCKRCNKTKLVKRPIRSLTGPVPVVHYGAIASGNQVMKDGAFRDKVIRKTKALCFEMEAAGLMIALPCLPIRGICDYSDSHKNKIWQRYAAASAAAYARVLLEFMPATQKHTGNSVQPVAVDESRIRKRRSEDMMDSLRFKHMESRYHTIRKAVGGTCGWVLQHVEYEAWLNPESTKKHHGLLWIRGKPGVGKSTIMKFLHDTHKTNQNGQDCFTSSFFFNARGGPLEHSVLGMYRSLLYSLLSKFEDLQKVFDDPQLPDRLDEDSFPVEGLKELFSQAIQSLNQRSFTCFVDALDECEDPEVEDMIHFFNDLTTITSDQNIQFKICFSSRHYPRINIVRGVKMTVENEKGHNADLKRYIASRLQVPSPYPFIDIQKKLLAKADGVFLWVVLVVDILNKESNRGEGDLQSKLNVTPAGLTELFRTILERDNEHPRDLLFSILWVAFAKRPLKPEELRHALLAGRSMDDPASIELAIEEEPAASAAIKNFIISTSKGLSQTTETRSMQSRVEFVHESVRDFLILNGGFQQLWPDLSHGGKVDAHAMLAKCCIAYLNDTYLLKLLKGEPVVANIQRSPAWHRGFLRPGEWVYYPKESQFPFLSYAADNFLYHANAISDFTTRGKFMTTVMSNNHIRGWLEAEHYYRSKSPKDIKDGLLGTTVPLNQSSEFLCYLVYHRLSGLIRAWLKNDLQVKFIVGRRRNPVTEAWKQRDEEALAALLDLPSNQQDETKKLIDFLDLRTDKDRFPGILAMAARYGFNDMIDVLISRGFLVDEMEEQFKTPLMWASEHGQANSVEKLLGYGADVNARDESGSTSLLLALNNGHRRVAMSLIENHARIDSTDKNGTTALELAASQGFGEIVYVLIHKGASVNRYGIHGSDALSAALKGGHHHVAELLKNGTPG